MGRKAYTTEECISKFNEVHGNLYSYTKVLYCNSSTSVIITCEIHGDFKQRPNDHIKGSGCPKCSTIRYKRSINQVTERNNTSNVVYRATLCHGDKYDYSLVECNFLKDNVKVICYTHGIFNIAAYNLVRGRGCPSCKAVQTGDRLRSNTEDFKRKVTDKFQNKYNLSEVDYGKNSQDKVRIGCLDHGYFMITPSNLLSGRGCPICAKEVSNTKPSNQVYVLTESTCNISKIGISHDANKRIEHINRESGLIFSLKYLYPLENEVTARNVERQVLKTLRNKFKQVDSIFSGSTECFYVAPDMIQDLILNITNKEHTNEIINFKS